MRQYHLFHQHKPSLKRGAIFVLVVRAFQSVSLQGLLSSLLHKERRKSVIQRYIEERKKKKRKKDAI